MKADIFFEKSICKYRFAFSALLFISFFIALYPFYQYILDDDGVGYATITRRWASGDYYRAINGLWSPLHCWVAVPFYKAGLDLLTAYKVSNACISIGILGVLHLLLQNSGVTKALQFIALLVSIPFLLYMSFYQLAADILFCFLFLLYIYLFGRENAFTDTKTIVAISIVGWLAYLSKAYAFPLFFLYFILWQIWLYKNSHEAEKQKQLFKNFSIGISLFLVLCLPWIIALHYKYGIWTFSYAGKLNLALDLLPYEPPKGFFFLSPPWPDSPTNWEDTFFAEHDKWDRFSIWVALPRLPKQLLHNFIDLVQTYNRLSFVSVATIIALFLYVLRHQNRWLQIFLFSIIVLPAGYAIVHIEDRFVWPIFFLLLIGGTYLLFWFFQKNSFSPIVQLICWSLFFSSFLMTPLNGLQDMMGQGKWARQLGDLMLEHKLTGRVASSANYYSPMRQVAFYSGSQYYESTPQDYFSQVLPDELRKHNIDYFYLFYGSDRELQFLQQSLVYKAAYKQFPFTQYNLVVLKMRP